MLRTTAPRQPDLRPRRPLPAVTAVAALAALAAALLPSSAGTAELPTGEEVMRQVNERPRGGDMLMDLFLVFHDKHPGDQTRDVEVERKQLDTGYRTTYRITDPDHLDGITLMISEDDDQKGMWMYFPAGDHLVPVVTRGLSALASDFSCEDLKEEYPLEEYAFRNLGTATLHGETTYMIEMIPQGERLSMELGYNRVVGWVLADRFILIKAEYFDEKQEGPYKTFEAELPKMVGGVWTVMAYKMTNHRAAHSTDATVRQVHYGQRLSEERFVPKALATLPDDPPAAR